jgi:hypothetical protein
MMCEKHPFVDRVLAPGLLAAALQVLPNRIADGARIISCPSNNQKSDQGPFMSDWCVHLLAVR